MDNQIDISSLSDVSEFLERVQKGGDAANLLI